MKNIPDRHDYVIVCPNGGLPVWICIGGHLREPAINNKNNKLS